MSFVDTRSALEQRFKLNWTRTPIKWQNVRFEVPADVSNNPQPYVAFTLRGGEGADITLGSMNPWYRWSGLIIVSVFVPENVGMGLVTLYADLIKKIFLDPPRDFQYLQSGVIRLLVPQAVEIGIVAGWCQTNILTAYRRDAQV
jgi:hypothetical protein